MNAATPSGRPPVPQQPGLNLKLSARIVLVDLQSVRCLRGVDAQSVLAMADNALHAEHLRFVFDFSTGRKLRELRFRVREVIAPETVAGLSLKDAIAGILGAGGRRLFCRGEIEMQWVLSAPLIMRLVRAGAIAELAGAAGAGNRLLRSGLEKFLKCRWLGHDINRRSL